jgi:hypothetical protein
MESTELRPADSPGLEVCRLAVGRRVKYVGLYFFFVRGGVLKPGDPLGSFLFPAFVVGAGY